MIKNPPADRLPSLAEPCSTLLGEQPAVAATPDDLSSQGMEVPSRKVLNEPCTLEPGTRFLPGGRLLNPDQIFFDNAPVGCMILTKKGTIRRINRSGAAMLGGGNQGLLRGKSLTRFIAPNDRLRFLEHLNSCSGSQTDEALEVHLRSRDRQPPLPVKLYTAFQGDDSGNRPLFLSVMTSIREHKETEEDLRRSEARYRHIVEDHTEMICRFSRSGKITFVNEAMCHGFRLPREEFTGMPMAQFIHRADRQRLKEHLAALNASEPMKTIELRVVMPDGRIRWHRWTHRVIHNGQGRFVEYQSAGRDITEQKETQEALLRAHNELEQKVVERTAELATINEALRDEIAEHKETQRKFLASHEQLRSLTSDLITTEERERRRIATEIHDHIGQTLAVTKIKLEMLHALASYSGFSEALEEIQGFVKQAIQETRSLMTKLSPPVFYELGLPSALEWLMQYFEEQHNLKIVYKGNRESFTLDEDVQILLLQATRELLMNVVKHAGVEKAELILKANKKQIQIEVIDQGSGFEVSKIGTPVDWRGGFGLFSVHERLKNLGGQLQIRSKSGEGTHFTLIAPYNTKGGN